MNGSNASASTTHGLMVVPKFFALKGPSGTYSHAWMSLADQSFRSTNPNILSAASAIGIGSPILFARQTKAPSSSSMSRRRLGVKVGILGSAVGFSRIWPHGLRMGVPETTTDEARPW